MKLTTAKVGYLSLSLTHQVDYGMTIKGVDFMFCTDNVKLNINIIYNIKLLEIVNS